MCEAGSRARSLNCTPLAYRKYNPSYTPVFVLVFVHSTQAGCSLDPVLRAALPCAVLLPSLRLRSLRPGLRLRLRFCGLDMCEGVLCWTPL